MNKKEQKKLKEQADEIIFDTVNGLEIRLDWLEREIEWHMKHKEIATEDFANGFIAGLKQAQMVMTAPLNVLCEDIRAKESCGCAWAMEGAIICDKHK